MTSVSSSPFLRFADSVPEWTLQDRHHHHHHTSNTRSTSNSSSRENGKHQHPHGEAPSSHAPIAGTVGVEQQLLLEGQQTHWSEPTADATTLTATPALAAGSEDMRKFGSSMCCCESTVAARNSESSAEELLVQVAKLVPHFKHHAVEILSDLQDKKIYLFLDYDGTLTPIVTDPSQAFLSTRMRSLLFNLASSNRVIVGVVTGRKLSSVKEFVQITASQELKFVYAASHGFHIEASGQQLHHKVGASYIPILREASLEVARALSHISGLTLEDNEFSVSVHYRNSPAECAAEVESTIDFILTSYPSLRKTRGKMVFELRINLAWDKGEALRWLLHAMEVNPADPDVRLIYVGDDLTDEDAFKVIRHYGNRHLPILVSDIHAGLSYDHRLTAASMRVDGVEEVEEFLTSVHRIVGTTQ